MARVDRNHPHSGLNTAWLNSSKTLNARNVLFGVAISSPKSVSPWRRPERINSPYVGDRGKLLRMRLPSLIRISCSMLVLCFLTACYSSRPAGQRTSITIPPCDWTISDDGRTLITAEGHSAAKIRWYQVSSMAQVAERTIPGPVNDFICVYGGLSVIAATPGGLWRLSPVEKSKLLLPNREFDRICQYRAATSPDLLLACFANYGASTVRISRGRCWDHKFNGFMDRYMTRQSTLLASSNGAILVPSARVRLDPSTSRFLPLRSTWPMQGIYDLGSNSNKSGLAVSYVSRTNPTDNTVFMWVSGRALCFDPNLKESKNVVRIPKGKRVLRMFLTDANDLWYEIPQTSSDNRIHLMRTHISN